MKPHWSERLKNYVEIAAIIIGGGWALFTFVIKDSPSLALRRKATSTLEWKSIPEKNVTTANFNITLENTGSSTFHIKKAHLQAWLADELQVDSGMAARYLDVNNIERSGKLFFDTVYSYSGNTDEANLGKPFIGRYNEGAVWNEDFEFLMKRDSKKIVVLSIVFYEENHIDEPFEWTYQWDYVGGGSQDTKISKLH